MERCAAPENDSTARLREASRNTGDPGPWQMSHASDRLVNLELTPPTDILTQDPPSCMKSAPSSLWKDTTRRPPAPSSAGFKGAAPAARGKDLDNTSLHWLSSYHISLPFSLLVLPRVPSQVTPIPTPHTPAHKSCLRLCSQRTQVETLPVEVLPTWVIPVCSGYSLHFPFITFITLVIKKLLCGYLFMCLSQLDDKLHRLR